MKQIISSSLSIFKENINELVAISLPFIVVMSLLDTISIATDYKYFTYIYYVLTTINHSIYMPVLIVFISLAAYNKSDTKRNIILRALLHTPYILICSVIIGVPAMIAVKISQKVNFLALILVMFSILFIVIKTFFTNYLIVLENNKPIEAIRNSFRHTKYYEGKIILLFVIVAIPIGIIGKIFQYVNQNIFNANVVSGFSFEIVSNILFIIFHIAFFQIYHQNWLGRKKAEKQ